MTTSPGEVRRLIAQLGLLLGVVVAAVVGAALIVHGRAGVGFEPEATMPPFYEQMAKDDPPAKPALEALWRVYQKHGDLREAFANNPKGLLKWAIDDAKNGSGYSRGELGVHAAALEALEPRLADPLPAYYARLSQVDVQRADALKTLWAVYQGHGDLQHSYVDDPVGLLLWAANDAAHGSGYDRKVLGPHAAALMALGEEIHRVLPDRLEQEASKSPKVRAAMQALWELYLDHGDLRSTLKGNFKGLILWAIDDAKHGSPYQPDKMGRHAAALLSLEPVA